MLFFSKLFWLVDLFNCEKSSWLSHLIHEIFLCFFPLSSLLLTWWEFQALLICWAGCLSSEFPFLFFFVLFLSFYKRPWNLALINPQRSLTNINFIFITTDISFCTFQPQPWFQRIYSRCSHIHWTIISESNKQLTFYYSLVVCMTGVADVGYFHLFFSV